MTREDRCERCVNWVNTNWHGTEGKCKYYNRQTKYDQWCDKFLKR